jgi:hypothetical protein
MADEITNSLRSNAIGYLAYFSDLIVNRSALDVMGQVIPNFYLTKHKKIVLYV